MGAHKREVGLFMKLSIPCSEIEPAIPGCEKLRQKYMKDINHGGGGCSKCRANSVKKKYGKIIANLLSNKNKDA